LPELVGFPFRLFITRCHFFDPVGQGRSSRAPTRSFQVVRAAEVEKYDLDRVGESCPGGRRPTLLGSCGRKGRSNETGMVSKLLPGIRRYVFLRTASPGDPPKGRNLGKTEAAQGRGRPLRTSMYHAFLVRIGRRLRSGWTWSRMGWHATLFSPLAVSWCPRRDTGSRKRGPFAIFSFNLNCILVC
jgi:hypothetical protein